MLLPQHFGFRKAYSAEYAIAHLVDQICKSFETKTTPLVFLSTFQRRFIT